MSEQRQVPEASTPTSGRGGEFNQVQQRVLIIEGHAGPQPHETEATITGGIARGNRLSRPGATCKNYQVQKKVVLRLIISYIHYNFCSDTISSGQHTW